MIGIGAKNNYILGAFKTSGTHLYLYFLSKKDDSFPVWFVGSDQLCLSDTEQFGE